MKRLGLLLGIIVLGVGSVLLWKRTAPSAPPPMVDPAANATYGDFTVQTATGPLALSDLAGRVVVVYFGYTHCPDICPTTLATVAAAVREVGEDDVTALMVSVDPERDTPERLAEYAAFFHPSFRAGTRDDIASTAADWGVVYRKVETGSAMGYAVDHGTDAFLVGRDGRLVERITHGTPAAEVAERIRRVR